ncbi:MAG: phosphatase PAP2 family protein [Oscillospiraceae bacterium]|nr:phosphatase PAP2 family protein [Oscillospiraceae bacterium]
MLLELDFSILYWIQAHLRCPFLDRTMPALSRLGDYGFIWILAALVLLLLKRHRRCGITLAAGLICSLLIGNLLLKPLAARPRPCWLDETVVLLTALPRDYSFPSGHSLSGFIAAAILLRYDRRMGVPALILASLIAFSRLYLFLHFPTDVLAGVLLGLGVGLGLSLLAERHLHRKEEWV